MSVEEEFAVVDMIVASTHETRGIDAFALALIKSERQMRKLFTHLIFQFPCFDAQSTSALREALGTGKSYYFEGFERGFDAVAPKTISMMVGNDYRKLRESLSRAAEVRNKVFHGQVTQGGYLRRDELLEYVKNTKRWCQLLAAAAAAEIGYDGFQRNSFRKIRPVISTFYRMQINDVEGYKRLLADYVQRRRVWTPPE